MPTCYKEPKNIGSFLTMGDPKIDPTYDNPYSPEP